MCGKHKYIFTYYHFVSVEMQITKRNQPLLSFDSFSFIHCDVVLLAVKVVTAVILNFSTYSNRSYKHCKPTRSMTYNINSIF